MTVFEVYIPARDPSGQNVTLTVEAPNWLGALKSGLKTIGEGAEAVANVMCDIKEDNSIHVTDVTSRRVFRLREVQLATGNDSGATVANLQRTQSAAPAPVALPQEPQKAFPKPTAPPPAKEQVAAKTMLAFRPADLLGSDNVDAAKLAALGVPKTEPVNPIKHSEDADVTTPVMSRPPKRNKDEVWQSGPNTKPTLPTGLDEDTAKVVPPAASASEFAGNLNETKKVVVAPDVTSAPSSASMPAPSIIIDDETLALPAGRDAQALRQAAQTPPTQREVAAAAPVAAPTGEVAMPRQAPPPTPAASVPPRTASSPNVVAPPRTASSPNVVAPPRTASSPNVAAPARTSSSSSQTAATATPPARGAPAPPPKRDSGQFVSAPAPQARSESKPDVTDPKIGREAPQRAKLTVRDAIEEVFDATNDLYSQKKLVAGDIANTLLDLALRLVPAESGSFYLADLNGHELAFAAVRGPKAQAILQAGLSVKVGQGIVGFCAQEGVCLVVADIQKDPRYFSHIADAIGYEPRDTLCASVEKDGRLFGAIQLINAKGGFDATHMEVLRYIGLTAATLLSRGV